MLDQLSSLIVPIISLFALMIAVVIHEYSHGLIADRLGDPTARINGRLTLNPIAHIDKVGSILVPLFLLISRAPFIIGWAKPVPIDVFNLRNPRRDAAIIALAGPVSNLILAVVCAVLLNILLQFRILFIENSFISIVQYLIIILLRYNVVLAVFNLIPIHPLDGFKIVEGLLPQEYARQWHELERYGIMFLLFLMFPIFGGVAPISQLISPIVSTILRILLP